MFSQPLFDNCDFYKMHALDKKKHWKDKQKIFRYFGSAEIYLNIFVRRVSTIRLSSIHNVGIHKINHITNIWCNYKGADITVTLLWQDWRVITLTHHNSPYLDFRRAFLKSDHMKWYEYISASVTLVTFTVLLNFKCFL